MAYPRPAQASISTSFGMSPKATTSARSTPRAEARAASVAALLTPSRDSSTRPSCGSECVAEARPATAGRASASIVSPALVSSEQLDDAGVVLEQVVQRADLSLDAGVVPGQVRGLAPESREGLQREGR